MQLTKKQFEKISPYFPKKRGKLSLSDCPVLNAILFVAKNGCKWWAIPKELDKEESKCGKLSSHATNLGTNFCISF
jgi:transposase